MKLFVDCTNTYNTDVNSGIQRVVRNIVKNLLEISEEKNDIQVSPVVFNGNDYIQIEPKNIFEKKKQTAPLVAEKYTSPLHLRIYHSLQLKIASIIPSKSIRNFITAPKEYFGLSYILSKPLFFLVDKKKSASQTNPKNSPWDDNHTGDILLLLDFAADMDIWRSVQAFRQRGGKVTTVVYDLIPIQHPETTADYLYGPFKRWLNNAIKNSDKIITISKTVKEDVESYIKINHLPPVKTDFFYLGSELDLKNNNTKPREEIVNVFSHEDTYLIVGSIEPRKNHSYALDAFEIVWSRNNPARLVIIGKNGWKNEKLIERIYNHPRFGKELYLIRDCSDTELEYAYDKSKALVFPSFAEGFGLPLVEASQRGLEIICSDIEIFKEIAQDNATYFNLHEPNSLADKIMKRQFLNKNTSKSNWITWKESSKMLLKSLGT